MPRLDDLFPARTTSESETRSLGRAMAESFRAGDVVGLYGDLGVGKTALTKGICAGLGLDPDAVTSPTFTLLIEYASGSLPVYHFDAYRLERLEEFFDLGYEEYFYGDGLCVIEWAERIEPLLPTDAIRIRLRHETQNLRHVDLVQA
ncbi:MAG: tRNA (adenosine(37)-N6)-threonylcarbamoyltransferase complex ATPase subunit type 1 TsaE [Rhodothermales bacterium]